MGLSEEKKKIVIDNYFKSECNINTTLKEAFTRGFELGLKKALAPQQGEWIGDTDYDNTCKCSKCRMTFDTDRLKMVMCDGKYELPNFCQQCGADMRKGGAE